MEISEKRLQKMLFKAYRKGIEDTISEMEHALKVLKKSKDMKKFIQENLMKGIIHDTMD